jgi:hypothetical protein
MGGVVTCLGLVRTIESGRVSNLAREPGCRDPLMLVFAEAIC